MPQFRGTADVPLYIRTTALCLLALTASLLHGQERDGRPPAILDSALASSPARRVPLPRGLSADELLLLPSYVPPAGTRVAPPPRPVRALAEYEEVEGIIVTWAYTYQDLLLSKIVDAAQEEGRVWILSRPNTSDSVSVQAYLASRGIPLDSVTFLSVANNSIWARDYGPWTVYDTVTDSMGIVDFRYNRPRPLDDVVPATLARLWDLPLYQAVTMPDSLAHPGGNFMVDGSGAGFASDLILNENRLLGASRIDSILLRYCGVDQFYRLDTLLYDKIHHIDMHVKLLDEETVLVGEYPLGIADHAGLEKIAGLFAHTPTMYGRPYRVVRIPMPADNSGRYPPQSPFLTYTNSLIVNGTVLVPIYNLPSDSVALRIYREAMPGYRILGLDCNSIIGQNGAIHCITKEVGVREPFRIRHARLRDGGDAMQSHLVTAEISIRGGVDSAFVAWKVDSDSAYDRVPMALAGEAWTASIPPQPPGVTVQYYIEAAAASGRRARKPLVGPMGPYAFTVTPALDVASSGEIGGAFALAQNYPNPFNPSSTIAFRLRISGHATLRVYDLLGRAVATLLDGYHEAGEHSVHFDGSRLSSGVYVYRLQSAGTTLTRRMLLLR